MLGTKTAFRDPADAPSPGLCAAHPAPFLQPFSLEQAASIKCAGKGGGAAARAYGFDRARVPLLNKRVL